MRIIYTIVWYLLLPILLLRLFWRARLAPAYRQRIGERLALGLSRRAQPCVWIHAVSVGETLAAAPMINALLARHPDTRLLVTTTTPTGSERVQQLFGDRVDHVYCPWDLPDALARFFTAWRPALVVVMETELWPNLVAAAHRRQVPVVLANGRLSEKSFRGYSRLQALMAPMLKAMTALYVQTDAEAERFRALGAPADRVIVTGSIKFDLAIDEQARAQAVSQRRALGEARPVWIAASTHPQEEAAVLDAHRQLLAVQPQALLVWVPRHPERFEAVASLVSAAGLSLARRSREQGASGAQVYLADSMGELQMLYGAADVAFVGGSLAPLGGHNLLEPAAWARPLLSGPSLFNFTAIAALLTEAGALTLVNDATTLAAALEQLFADVAVRTQAGEAGAAVVDRHRGALEKLLQGLASLWP